MALATPTHPHRPTYFITRTQRGGRSRTAAVRPAVLRRAQSRRLHQVAVAVGFGILQMAAVVGFSLLMLLGLPGALG